MSGPAQSEGLVRQGPLLRDSDTIGDATRRLMDSDLPALCVVDENDRLVGIFGERELIGSIFPGYFKELHHAGFVPRSLDATLEKRATCVRELVRDHMNTEKIAVPTDFSDAQVAETVLHHRVLIVPVVDGQRRVQGLITRTDFSRMLADHLLDPQ